ncbi:MAG TPA: hypothetical protein VLD58_01150 [Gemmatimonadales bacterium]|nr:hypothetical protein [Gemmatimonadales bacterium]
MRAIGWMTLAATVVLAACGGDGNGSTGPGNGGATSFSAEVTGDVQTSVRGAALFGTRADEAQGMLFGVEMAESGAGESVIQIIRLGGEVPAVGTYQIVDALNGNPQNGDFVAMAFDSDNGQPTAIFVGTGGTLRVTSSSATAFKGTFTFDAQGGLFSDPETTLTIKVDGSFHATPAPEGIQLKTIRSR